jgi:TetR/AcrR family transcriptional regulator, transcriptional repressor for nem operon
VPGIRKPEFDVPLAVDRAKDVFWSDGLQGASVADLLEATGIARQSLYNTLGDKQALFAKCLDAYSIQFTTELRQRLSRSRGPLAELKRFIRSWNDVRTAIARRGCLMCNAAIESPKLSPDARVAVGAHMDRFVEVLEYGLLRAQERSDLDKTTDCRAVARTLVALAIACSVLRRCGKPHQVLDGSVRAGLALLGKSSRRRRPSSKPTRRLA